MDPKYSTLDSALKGDYDAEIQFPSNPVPNRPTVKAIMELFQKEPDDGLSYTPQSDRNFRYDVPTSASDNDLISHSRSKSKDDLNRQSQMQSQLAKKLAQRREEQQRKIQMEKEKEEQKKKQEIVKKVPHRQSQFWFGTSSTESSPGTTPLNTSTNSYTTPPPASITTVTSPPSNSSPPKLNGSNELAKKYEDTQPPQPQPQAQQQQPPPPSADPFFDQYSNNINNVFPSSTTKQQSVRINNMDYHKLQQEELARQQRELKQQQDVLAQKEREFLQIQASSRTLSTASGLSVTMEDLIRCLKEEKTNHQHTKHLLMSIQEENKKMNTEILAWKAKYYKLQTKLHKVNVILNHFQTIMADETGTTPPTGSPPTFKSASHSHASLPPTSIGSVPSSTSGPLSGSSPTNSINSSYGPGFNTIKSEKKRDRGGTFGTHSSNKFMISPDSFLKEIKTEIVITNGTEGLNLTEEEFLGLLERRKVIALQIIKTEKEYESNLSVIVSEFLKPMKEETYQSSNPFVTMGHVKQIFGDVEVIHGSSKLLIEDLEKAIPMSNIIGLGDVFLKVCDYFKLYSPYINNYYTSISVLNKLKEESHKFTTFISEKEETLEGSNFNDLGSLLVLPVTRIGSYTNMLAELFYATPHGHPDYEPFKAAVLKMKSIVDYVKEKTREHENQNKVRMIQASMQGKFKNLNQPHRRYVKEGELQEVVNGKPSATPYIFLFNDILIVTSKKSSSYQFKKEIKLADAEVAIINENDRPLFQISYTTQEDQLQSSNPGLLLEQVHSLAAGITSSPEEKEGNLHSITFLADSVKDREEWVYNLAQSIATAKKTRKPDELSVDSTVKTGTIDFQNSEIQLCELLGQGGSGCLVHRCTVDGFTCAVKVLKLKNTPPFLIDQFVGEISLMVQLNHQNIAKYLGHRLTRDPDRLWLFMEYYPYSMKDIISKRTIAFPPSEIIWMALEIAKGIEFLHKQTVPVVHRDLKPGNIMCSLDEKNRVCNIRVCDFDTSKTLLPGTILKTCIGTPCYMAPEVLDVNTEGTDGYTIKADIWSFAMLVYEIIALHPPYHEFSHLNSIEMILKGTPPPLPPNLSSQLQPLLDYLFHHCTDLNPSKRPTSSDVVKKLTKLLKNSGKYNE